MSINQLEKLYREKVVPEMRRSFGYKNDLAVPRLVKAVINIGTGNATRDEKTKQAYTETLTRITGQKPVVRLARKSISSFKVRKGMAVGLSVTIRRRRLYDFVNKLVNVTLPRVRDFQGLEPKSLDGNGNLNIGFKENTVFPEIKPDEVENIHGLEVAIVTNAKSNKEALKLFELLGFPFKK
ncbi:MAG: 50S ribosomal protein L5 [Patescibacteria group bacterium]|nr:50S ribosomal protein L5 [Patescibacteria group bacterium]MDD5567479.1 50S ribosomal protein L5 [Patescibacteria group bacterium]